MFWVLDECDNINVTRTVFDRSGFHHGGANAVRDAEAQPYAHFPF